MELISNTIAQCSSWNITTVVISENNIQQDQEEKIGYLH